MQHTITATSSETHAVPSARPIGAVVNAIVANLAMTHNAIAATRNRTVFGAVRHVLAIASAEVTLFHAFPQDAVTATCERADRRTGDTRVIPWAFAILRTPRVVIGASPEAIAFFARIHRAVAAADQATVIAAPGVTVF